LKNQVKEKKTEINFFLKFWSNEKFFDREDQPPLIVAMSSMRWGVGKTLGGAVGLCTLEQNRRLEISTLKVGHLSGEECGRRARYGDRCW
jgi:hypothetical protein